LRKSQTQKKIAAVACATRSRQAAVKRRVEARD
jgi:hypothetical protein